MKNNIFTHEHNMTKILSIACISFLLVSCSEVECHSTKVTDIVKQISKENALLKENILNENYKNSDIHKTATQTRDNCLDRINETKGYNLRGEMECIEAFDVAEDEIMKIYMNEFHNVTYSLNEIITLKKDSETSRLICEAKLTANLSGWGSSASRLEYIVDSTSKDELLVRVAVPPSIK
ncbi:MAG: hypothetical protein A0129_12625 [Limnobacter sp. CACIAM 66H1]|uniref:hypothetical protein n=1 Tax=Limnobacter sp. CACIAM 66H1 TaxID=1813033 RepID=UPI0007A87C76|nr:hypothetical protein [Limnobacter sp. CACIAM 66H1]KYP10483.1 MAG: hypothetical protein A0129_12625 [Limnobacter sp. CACIAM 66H1]